MQKLNKIWLTKEESFKNPFKFKVWDDIGDLWLTDCVEFKGEKTSLRIMEINSISLITKIKLTNFFLQGAFIIGFTFLFGGDVFYVTAILVLGLPVVLLVTFLTKWVELECTLITGEKKKFFLSDGRYKGWSGIFGGTKKLYLLLLRHYQEKGRSSGM